MTHCAHLQNNILYEKKNIYKSTDDLIIDIIWVNCPEKIKNFKNKNKKQIITVNS